MKSAPARVKIRFCARARVRDAAGRSPSHSRVLSRRWPVPSHGSGDGDDDDDDDTEGSRAPVARRDRAAQTSESFRPSRSVPRGNRPPPAIPRHSGGPVAPTTPLARGSAVPPALRLMNIKILCIIGFCAIIFVAAHNVYTPRRPMMDH